MRSFVFVGAAALLSSTVFAAPLARRNATSDGSSSSAHGPQWQIKKLLTQASVALTVDQLSADDFTTLEDMVLTSPTDLQATFIETVGVGLLGSNTTDFNGNITSDVVTAFQSLDDEAQRMLISLAVAASPSDDQYDFLWPDDGSEASAEAESDTESDDGSDAESESGDDSVSQSGDDSEEEEEEEEEEESSGMTAQTSSLAQTSNSTTTATAQGADGDDSGADSGDDSASDSGEDTEDESEDESGDESGDDE